MKKKFCTFILLFSLTTFSLADGGDPWSPSRPDGHAPIGVMGEHTHAKGEWMLSYRYMAMRMKDNRSGSNRISDAQVLQQFMVTPTEMSMQMHMLGVMVAPSHRLTLMAMLPYVIKEMDHITRSGRSFTTESKGIGDVKTTALIKLWSGHGQHIHANAGVSLPTGPVDNRDTTPLGPDRLLPYPMQIGSGTFDLLPGLTYLGQTNRWSWGAQSVVTVRLGNNHRDYRFGNQIEATVWGAAHLADWISSSLRVAALAWGDVRGRDTALNPNLVPTADPSRRGGERMDIFLGLNLLGTHGILKGHRIAAEIGVPFYQHLDGPQLETDVVGTLGWQKSF